MAYSTRKKASSPHPHPVNVQQKTQTSFPVVIKSLSKQTNENTLFHNFKRFGVIIPNGVTILKNNDGTSKCMGYVNYINPTSSQKAIVSMDGRVIDGSRIEVEDYVQKVERSISSSSQEDNNGSEDYRPITDCNFYMQGRCKKQEGCAYRHPSNTKAEICNSWRGDTCKNITCPFLHPPKKNGSLPSKQSLPTNTTASPSEPATLKVNTPVEVTIHSKQYRGIVRWCGFIEEMNNSMAGIELDKAIDGGCNGNFQGKKYFSCAESRGYFVVSTQCKKLYTPDIGSLSLLTPTKKDFICGFYLKNLCINGDNCSAVHPPYSLPYCWYYQIQGETEVSICPKDVTEAIEEKFRDVKSTDFATSNFRVNFEDLTQSRYSDLKATFKRISTPSTALSKGTNEPLTTTWKWYWYDDETWHEYHLPGTATSEMIENKYDMFKNHDGPTKMDFRTAQFYYSLRFKLMNQKNLKTNKRRCVRRRPAPFQNESKQRTLSASLDDFPVHWTSAPVTGYIAIPVKNDVRSKIERDFAQTMEGRMNYNIISVEEICNRQLYRQYVSKKKNMEESNKGQVKEMQLWHGTRNDIVEKICQQNFDWRMVEKHSFGKGSYFAKKTSYSCSYTSSDPVSGICSMFYADVLVGYCAKGCSTYTRPPEREKNILYDSCVNDIIDPSIFVIFERDQFYPRYLIKYKRSILRR
ncbi:protein mono-ADP-ribosyltransferase PARP12-like [Clytia hemisphaerica]|uniref:Poly [ADP-ribose] polymerase 12 n=1 Tax=Clytia hemisphaerica TaxID=252671 RepID=A0A7M5V7I8_9CNID